MFESLFNQKTMYIDSSGLVMRNLLARHHFVGSTVCPTRWYTVLVICLSV